MTERRACRLANQPRGTQRYRPAPREDEDALTQAIVALASQYGRYGYRRITALLRRAGWLVGKDRVERIWRREGLKIPRKWLADTGAKTLYIETRLSLGERLLREFQLQAQG
jgi:putative transposase